MRLRYSFFLLLITIIFSTTAIQAQSYADQILSELEIEVAKLEKQPDPVEQFLLTERLYYLGHETGQQEKVTALLARLYQNATHAELQAEIGYFLSQQYRQLGQYDKTAELVRQLGYVSEWTVLGPLAPGTEFRPKDLLSKSKVKGLDRMIEPQVIPAYGRDDFWAMGLGHYGYFNTNSAVYPNQLAGVLLTTWFKLPDKDTVRLGMGWNHRARVWIDQTEVLNEKADQESHPDQRVMRFSLKKGWHRLCIYIESKADEPSLGFYARLTDAKGAAIPTEARSRARAPRKNPIVLDQAEAPLVALASKKSPYALASVLLMKEQRQHPDYDAPKDLLARALKEGGANQLVADKLLTFTEDPNEKWQILTEFLKVQQQAGQANGLDRAWALSQLGQIALSQQRYWEARKYASKALAAHSGYWPAQILENNTLAALSLEGQALRNTLQLNEKYPGVPWILMDLSDLYWEVDYREESRRQVEEILALRRANNKFAERKIKVLRRAGELDAMDAFFSDLIRDSPFSLTTVLSYTQFLMANGRAEKAEHLLASYMEMIPENPLLLERMGELMLRENRKGEALPYLEKALALRPQNPALENLIALSKKGESSFFEPYRIAEIPDIDVLEVSPIVVNVDNTVVKVFPSGQSSTYHQLEWEIITDQGVTELPGYSFSYAPLRQKAEVVRAEILRGDQVIHMSRFGRARVSDPAYRMYYDLVAYQVAFPPLEVGDKVRVEYRIDDTGSHNIFGDYFGDLRYFKDRYPTRQVSYTLIVPKERTLHYHVEKMTPEFKRSMDGDNQVFQWTLNRVSPFETESRMPGLAGYMPYVAVSTFNDWQNMASWYADLIQDQLDLDHETRAIVKDLTQGVTDRLEIVKKIHEYVVTHTRYVALEFGIHGYKPYQVNQVNSRQFGDCKDKASLIVSMLREAGIPAQIAIVRTVDKGYVHTYPAMLAYFNHAIAYVPEFDLYLDGTAEFSGIDELPAMDQGALTLLVDEKGVGKLTKIPVSSNNHENYALSFSVKSDGMTDVAGSLTYNGVSTPSLREYLTIDAKLAQNLQTLMRDTLPGLDVLEANREGRSINEPITLHFTGRTNQLLQRIDGHLTLPLSILGEELTQEYAANASRQFPIDIGVPKTQTVELTIDAPEGYELGALPESLEVEDENFKVRLTVNQVNKASCKVNYQVVFKTSRVEPDDYPKLRKLMQEHDRVLDQTIKFVAQ